MSNDFERWNSMSDAERMADWFKLRDLLTRAEDVVRLAVLYPKLLARIREALHITSPEGETQPKERA